jgi:hypothetical protein
VQPVPCLLIAAQVSPGAVMLREGPGCGYLLVIASHA